MHSAAGLVFDTRDSPSKAHRKVLCSLKITIIPEDDRNTLWHNLRGNHTKWRIARREDVVCQGNAVRELEENVVGLAFGIQVDSVPHYHPGNFVSRRELLEQLFRIETIARLFVGSVRIREREVYRRERHDDLCLTPEPSLVEIKIELVIVRRNLDTKAVVEHAFVGVILERDYKKRGVSLRRRGVDDNGFCRETKACKTSSLKSLAGAPHLLKHLRLMGTSSMMLDVFCVCEFKELCTKKGEVGRLDRFDGGGGLRVSVGGGFGSGEAIPKRRVDRLAAKAFAVRRFQ
jgi:hypothetical protein